MSCADACTLACLLPVDTFLLEQLVAIIKLLTTCVFLFQFEFEGEEGTGLGPTLEFYSLVAAALQEKSLGIFLCDDDTHDHVGQEVLHFEVLLCQSSRLNPTKIYTAEKSLLNLMIVFKTIIYYLTTLIYNKKQWKLLLCCRLI